MKKRPSYLLLSFLVLVTMAYHGLNSAEGRFCASSWNHSPVPIELKLGSVSFIRFSPVTVVRSKGNCDAFSGLVADWGHIGRYLLGQVHDRILKGHGSKFEHIYYREELPFLFNGLNTAAEIAVLERMRRLSAELVSAGAHVVWVPVPTKLGLELDLLNSPLPPESPWGSTNLTRAARRVPPRPYEIYKRWVDLSDGHTVDIAKAFRESARLRDELLYVPYDNHWSSFGIGVAVQAVVGKLRATLPELEIPVLDFAQSRGVVYDHYLLVLLGLPSGFMKSSPRFQWNEPLYSARPPTERSLHGRVILAGTSQSARLQGTGFSFGESLSRSLQRELVEESVVGGGIFGGLSRLNARGVEVRSGDIVVWEFPDWVKLDSDAQPQLRVAPAPFRELTEQTQNR